MEKLVKRTYEEIENDILKIRKDLVEGIRVTLEEKGYGIDDTITGELVSIKVDMDWDHITIRDDIRENFNKRFYHVDDCSVETLLDAYEVALHAWGKY